MTEIEIKIVRTLIMTFLLGVLIYMVYQSRNIFFAGLIGIGFSVLAMPLVEKVSKKTGWGEPVSALLIMGAFTLFVGLFLFLFGAFIWSQFSALNDKVPDIVKQWESYVADFGNNYPKIKAQMTSPDSTAGFASNILKFVSSFSGALLTVGTTLSAGLLIGFFTTLQQRYYYEGFVGFFGKSRAKKIKEYSTVVAESLQKWSQAQLLDMCVVGFLTSLGLWIVGVDHWVVYGLSTGLLAIVPYAGISLMLVFSGSIVAVLQPDKLWWLILVFLIAQFIEGNFVLPRLMKSQVDVPAVPLIFLMILSGAWLGILGVFLTPPLLAVSTALLRHKKAL